MDIEKLEKLSCLKIKPEHREAMQQNLQGVLEMMRGIDALSGVQELVEVEKKQPLASRDRMVVQEMVKRDQDSESLHLHEGFFLAPKVVKK